MMPLTVPLQQNEWATGIVGEQSLYLYTAVFMAFVALAILGWTLRLPSNRRKYGLIAVFTSIVLSVTYLGMWQAVLRFETLDGAPVPLMRFAGYLFGTTTILLMIGRVGGFSRRLQAGMMLAFFGITGGTVGGWFFEPPISQLASLSTLLSLPFVAYILLGPGATSAGNTTDDRRLLYGKLGNLALLVWLGYLVVGVTSRQNLALLDGFAGVFLGAYIDVALYIGFAVILLRAGDALDEMAGGTGDGDATQPRSDAGPDGSAVAD